MLPSQKHTIDAHFPWTSTIFKDNSIKTNENQDFKLYSESES